MTKFNSEAEANTAAAALLAAGKITAWSSYRQFGKHVVRIQIAGKAWFNLTNRDGAGA